jgi:sugar/nucleoside kinase (ribokinase family)
LLAKVSEADLEDLATVGRVAATVLAKGIEDLAVLLGERGAFHACKDGRRVHVSSLRVDVDVVDTTAVGDTFVAMFSVLAVEASSLSESDVEAAVLLPQRLPKRVRRFRLRGRMSWTSNRPSMPNRDCHFS